MKRFFVAILFSFVVLGVAQVSFADKDFYGIVESRPDGILGTWVIGGKSVEATEITRLDEDYGPIKVGSCVEVDIDDGKVEEIESEPPHKCKK